MCTMLSSYRQINEFQEDTPEYANSKFKHKEQKLDKTSIFWDFTLQMQVN
jgi:hypothetical protein